MTSGDIVARSASTMNRARGMVLKERPTEYPTLRRSSLPGAA